MIKKISALMMVVFILFTSNVFAEDVHQDNIPNFVAIIGDTCYDLEYLNDDKNSELISRALFGNNYVVYVKTSDVIMDNKTGEVIDNYIPYTKILYYVKSNGEKENLIKTKTISELEDIKSENIKKLPSIKDIDEWQEGYKKGNIKVQNAKLETIENGKLEISMTITAKTNSSPLPINNDFELYYLDEFGKEKHINIYAYDFKCLNTKGELSQIIKANLNEYNAFLEYIVVQTPNDNEPGQKSLYWNIDLNNFTKRTED